MRGTQVVGINVKEDDGITPAYAGNTFGLNMQLLIRKDHPRLCGEHDRHTR